jgi:transcriptional regulator with XRE-family HTH domain
LPIVGHTGYHYLMSTKKRVPPKSTARQHRASTKQQADESDGRLGGNIKTLRTIKGLKLRELAARVGRSESLLSKIETGAALPSVTVLHSIVAALDTTIGALYAENGRDRGIIARAGERPAFVIDQAGSKLERLINPDPGHLLQGNLHTLAPGGGSEGQLAHVGEEVGFIVEGQFELVVGDEVYLLNAGDSFVFRSEIPHSYRNPGKTWTKVVWVSTPPSF